jgi:anti-sigma B factor antagonist
MIFTVTAQRTAMMIRLCVAGEIDTSTAGQLGAAITNALGAGISGLLVDLAPATFCDCAGITALLAGRRAAVAHDVTYQVINPSGIVLKVLQISGLHGLLTTRTR